MSTIRKYKKVWTTNANTSSFASKIPTTTEPVNDGVVDLRQGSAGLVIPNYVKLLVYGLGSDNDVDDVRFICWNSVGNTNTGVLWIPEIVCNFTATFSAAVGIAGAPVINTERFADTYALKTDNVVSQPVVKGADNAGVISMGEIKIFSPVQDFVGFIILPLYGAEKFELTFDQTTGTSTTNALWKFVDSKEI